MSIFDQLNGQQVPRGNIGQMQQATADALRQLQNNPAAMVRQRGLSIPDGMNSPEQMVRHILNSGQVTGPRAQMAQMLMQRMGLK